MSNKDFEAKVLSALDTLTTDVSGLKDDVSWLKSDVSWLKDDVSILKDDVSNLDLRFDRLENLMIDNTDELKQTIKLQWAYLNQAFDRIWYYNSVKK